MNRSILVLVFAVFATASLNAQQQSQQQTTPDPYEGQSHPPADDTITAPPPEQQPKPPAGKPMVTPAPAPVPQQTVQRTQQTAPAPSPAPVAPPANASDDDGTDDGIVQVAPDPQSATPGQPVLNARSSYANDPDGDIVHPTPLPPDTLESGTMIRARLLTQLSTAMSQRGDAWRARVASDVMQDGQVLIPAGAEIDGRVVDVSEGHAGGHGSMRLRPDTVILSDGSHYRIDAQVVGTPGANTNVTGEGVINAGSRWKKDGVEYGGAVGAGAATGAVMGGPVGAAAGSLVGAGLITAHLLMDHPQAVLDPGTVLLFTLNSRLSLTATAMQGN